VDYLQFKRQFDAEYDALVLPGDCKEISDPIFVVGTQYSWHVKWYLKFSDDKFVRIWEHHSKLAGLQDARRLAFAYHYGPIDGLDKDGLPAIGSNKPVEFRIDNSAQRVHLHLGGPEHIYQENVGKLDLESSDMFTFLSRIFEHRSTGKTFDKVFGFKII
jgi:hypothetical protein